MAQSVHRCTVSNQTTRELTTVMIREEDVDGLNAVFAARQMSVRMFPDKVGVHQVCPAVLEALQEVIGDRPLL